jgi:hypothetical protein
MENLFITIVCIALIMLASVSYASSSLSSADAIGNSFKTMAERVREIGRTNIIAENTTTADGSAVEITLRNDGNTALRNYSRWDVIVRYANGTTTWIPYQAADGRGWWSDNGTFLNGSPDVFEPGILNPGETLKINVYPNPAVDKDTTTMVVVSTDNGVNTQKVFNWTW